MPKKYFNELNPLPENPNTLIARTDLPNYLPLSVQTLAKWAVLGKGPIFRKLGSRVAYTSGDVQSWIDEQRRENTVST
jgi:hypothetical protein